MMNAWILLYRGGSSAQRCSSCREYNAGERSSIHGLVGATEGRRNPGLIVIQTESMGNCAVQCRWPLTVVEGWEACVED